MSKQQPFFLFLETLGMKRGVSLACAPLDLCQVPKCAILTDLQCPNREIDTSSEAVERDI